jgi:hypothetical protein
MRKEFFFIAVGLMIGSFAAGQELNARISVNSSQVSSQVDRKVFQNLQSSLNTLLNNRKWTTLNVQSNERIECNFLLTLLQAQEDNVYKASLTIQAARPVYNTSYQTPLINFIDESVTFRYVEFQQLEFNENRVGGTDALSSNLTAVLAYYVYVIIGLDHDSYSLRGGDPYFQKAQSIVNNSPEGRDISGWTAFDNLRNRYWLMENLVNNRYAIVHDALYSYYRLGLDFMYENEAEARGSILNALNLLTTLNNDIPNSMIVQFFFQGKSTEMIGIFKKAPPAEKQRAQEMLMRLDISNSNTYKQELK